MLRSILVSSVVVVALVVLSVGTFASGDIIIADIDNPVAYTIEEVNAAGGIQVGDKLFSDWRVTDTESVNAIAPNASEIVVTGIQIGGDYGLRFNSGWSAPAGQLADSTIKFKVSIVEPWLSERWLIKDNALWITAFGVSNNTDAGAVSVSENVYAFDPDVHGWSQPIANKFVYYKDDDDNILYDEKDFVDDMGVPVALTEIWVIKDVIAYGGVGTVGTAHISEFFQTFSQVPEPATMALLGLGGIGVLLRRRRR
ncbi:MAG: PEP-CTERM sorting domain-containing protein [Phycisphaerae bacterium]|nr:PEP-CTERM sorting domain-containing protein [Phycisphaerae bacterium]